ncbi:MAG: 23S rRNA (adenine(2503)-C(2))-methyltransferase RlmN [Luteococcus japonicus]|uniref:23S rRNA (adenine(2503)-C(2))-methyltransferase RlmN n=1 Tax=Luteococcus sp. TaxID=1969402 RepID=UPI002648F0D9|nr:23S rRNA (adenine(2503)-C(2))-methyltransferase RlmN [Luteococcus sp.]MDN5564120.1 23S rRNA (adenine(2503)-C(2))-methyltransferase RlmN [Luteococcus sp.]
MSAPDGRNHASTKPLVLPAEPLADPGKELPLVFAAPRRGKPAKHWIDLSTEERVQAVRDLGLPAFRAQQISKHFFERFETDPTTWSDLPKAAREQVAERFFPELVTPMSEQRCDGDTTVKTLWRLHDGSLVESVLMRYGVKRGLPDDQQSHVRSTLCISSQAGCGMACPFCATGQGGLQRNMSTGEIVAQVMKAEQVLSSGELPGGAGQVNNIVFMGMGEPLANYKAVMGAVRAISDPTPDGLGMSKRGITVSTVGLVPRIEQLTAEGLPITLAISLHAPDDELRDELVPINTRYKVDEVLDAAWDYAKTTKRRVSIEYIMIKDINDQPERAALLAKRLKARGDWGWVHVNLIPLNPTPGSKWTASRKSDEQAFVKTLENWGIPVTVRDTRGQEIDGACGQLAATLK